MFTWVKKVDFEFPHFTLVAFYLGDIIQVNKQYLYVIFKYNIEKNNKNDIGMNKNQLLLRVSQFFFGSSHKANILNQT